MQEWTRKGIFALMSQDKTVRPEEIQAVMRCISGLASCVKVSQGMLGKRDMDRVMTCEAVARLLKVSCKRVVALAEKGLIKRIEVCGNGGAIGFSHHSVLGYRNTLVT